MAGERQDRKPVRRGCWCQKYLPPSFINSPQRIRKGTIMIRIGIVGIGFMGMIHFLAARKLKDARVEGICSRDEKKLAGDWRSIQGNFGPRGEMMDLTSVKKCSNLDDLLADKDIDLID